MSTVGSHLIAVYGLHHAMIWQEKEDDLARDEQIFASKMKEIKRYVAQLS